MDTYLPGSDEGFWERYRVKMALVGVFFVSLFFGLWYVNSRNNFDVNRPAIKELVNAQSVLAMIRYQDLGMLRLEGARFNVPIGYVHNQKDAFHESIFPSYLLMPVYTVFGFDLGKIVYFYVILGALASVMVFVVARMLFGFWQGVFAGVFYSSSATVWLNSTVPMHSSFSPLLFLIVFYFLFQIISGKNGYKNWSLLAFFTALSLQFQAINLLWAVTVPIIVIFFKYQKMFDWKKVFLTKIVFLFTLSPIFIAELNNGFVQTRAWVGYLPTIFLKNFGGFLVDFFVSIGKNLVFYFLPGATSSESIMWIFGLGLLVILLLRMRFWRNSDQVLVKNEKIIYLFLIITMVGGYINYLAYFKSQLEYVAVSRSFGFYFPILAIFVSMYVSFDLQSKKRVISVIMVVLMFINMFSLIKLTIRNADDLHGYEEKKAVVREVFALAGKKNYSIEIDSDLFDPTTYVYLSDIEEIPLPVLINGTSVVRNRLFQQGDTFLTNIQIGNDTVVIKSTKNLVLQNVGEADIKLLVTDVGIDNLRELRRIGKYRIFVKN